MIFGLSKFHKKTKTKTAYNGLKWILCLFAGSRSTEEEEDEEEEREEEEEEEEEDEKEAVTFFEIIIMFTH